MSSLFKVIFKHHEEGLKEESKLTAGVLLPLAQVVAVVHQVRVQGDLQD